MFDFSKLKSIDLQVVILTLVLSIIGIVNIFATTYFPNKEISQLVIYQLIFIIFGVLLMGVVSIFDYRRLYNIRFIILLFSLNVLLLILVLFIGEVIYGARRWISLGLVNIQPSEFSKVSLVIITGYLFSSELGLYHIDNRPNFSERIKQYFKSKTKLKFIYQGVLRSVKNILQKNNIKLLYSILVWLVFVVFIMLQNSLGNALLITFIYFSMVYLGVRLTKFLKVGIFLYFLGISGFVFQTFIARGGNLFEGQTTHHIYLLYMFLVILVLLVLRYFELLRVSSMIFLVFGLLTVPFLTSSYNVVLQPYQRSRIESLLNPSQDPDSPSSWNREQSLIACGSGQLFGKGFLNGTQSNYRFLPFSYTDFAYCSYVEQVGLLGALFLQILYILLFVRLYQIGANVQDKFGKLIVFGVMVFLALNSLQHIGMNVGILPITGVPLVFMSYGGSFALVTFLSIGLVLSVKNFGDQKVKYIKKFNV